MMFRIFIKIIATGFVVGLSCSPITFAQDALPPPLDTISVDISGGLARVLSGQVASVPYAVDLVLRAGFVGTDEDRRTLREIARRYSDERTLGLGARAIRSLALLGGEQPFFLEVLSRWDSDATPGQRVKARDPALHLAHEAASYLSWDPTPESMAALDSLRKVEGSFGSYYGNSLTAEYWDAEYRALASDEARAERAVSLAARGWADDTDGHSAAAIYDEYGIRGGAPLGWRWLRELSRDAPQAVAAAILTSTAEQEAHSRSWYLERQGAGPRASEFANVRAAQAATSYLRYVGALTSPEVRALIDPTGETWTRSPYENPYR